MIEACTWPEQDAVDNWLEKHGINVSFQQAMELKKAVSAYRIQVQQQIAAAPKAEQPQAQDLMEHLASVMKMRAETCMNEGDKIAMRHFAQRVRDIRAALSAPAQAQDEREALQKLDRTHYSQWRKNPGGYVCGDIPTAEIVKVVEAYRALTTAQPAQQPEDKAEYIITPEQAAHYANAPEVDFIGIVRKSLEGKAEQQAEPVRKAYKAITEAAAALAALPIDDDEQHELVLAQVRKIAEATKAFYPHPSPASTHQQNVSKTGGEIDRLSDEDIVKAWEAQRQYHGGEPCKLGHLEFARAIERALLAKGAGE